VEEMNGAPDGPGRREQFSFAQLQHVIDVAERFEGIPNDQLAKDDGLQFDGAAAQLALICLLFG